MIVVGDVNSTLSTAFATHNSVIKVAHLERGLCSFNKEMPKGINHLLADMYFVTEQSGIDNLQKDGQSVHKMNFMGNTMIDTIVIFQLNIETSPIFRHL